jgi:hypothetical protein
VVEKTDLELLHVGKDVLGVLGDHRRVKEVDVVLKVAPDVVEDRLALVRLAGVHPRPVVRVLKLVFVVVRLARDAIAPKPVAVHERR